MTKLKLDIDEVFDLALIGISCHEKDYRFAWALNTYAGFDLKRAEDIEMGSDAQLYFPHYIQDNEEQHCTYRCIVNRFENTAFMTELKNFDYLLIVEGVTDEDAIQRVLQRLQQVEVITFATPIDWTKLKQKELILF